MKVAEGKLVKVAYDLFLDGYNKELAYSTKNEEDGSGCIEFECGKGELLEPMEAKLVGMEPGQEFKFMIPKDEAYGDIDEDLFIGFPKSEFIDETGAEDMPEEGDIVPMEDEDGIVMNAVVNEITDDHVVLDFNPIYAGEDLYFIGKILDVRNAK